MSRLAPKHVLLVVGQLGRGGTERQLVLLATALRERGLRVTVAALYGGGSRQAELEASDVEVWVGNVPRKWQVWRLAASLIAFLRLVRRTRPDVLHAFLFHAYVLAGPIGRLAGVPVLVAGRRSLGNFLDGRPVLQLAERLTNRCYDAFVANAEAVAADSLRRERMEPRRMHVVPNALPADAFLERRPERQRRPAADAICVANLIHYKGHRYLLDALAIVRSPVRARLVGDGPERAALERQAAASGADVAFLGARPDVAELLQAADLFVLPSLEEGMSNAIMEAMAAGLPVIATDVGGNAEVLGGTGILCRPADAEDLARALDQLLDDPSRAQELAEAALDRAKSAFTVERLVTRHLDLYRDLLEARCAA